MTKQDVPVQPNTMETFGLWELEKEIYEKEGVRVLFRAPARLSLIGKRYNEIYTNVCPGNARLTVLTKRIQNVIKQLIVANQRGFLSTIPSHEITFDYVDGKGNFPNGGQYLTTVRNSYSK